MTKSRTETELARFALLASCCRMSAHDVHMRDWVARRGDERVFTAAANASGELVLEIMDVIGGSFWYDGVTSKDVKRALDSNPNAKSIRVLVDSPGGSVFDGLAIQSLLKRDPRNVECEVIGEAASAATLPLMAADKTTIHEGAMVMIHRAAVMSGGFSDQLRADADLLDKITGSIIDLYAARTGMPRDQIETMVNAETWMSAREAVDKSFADEMAPAKTKASAKNATDARVKNENEPALPAPEPPRTRIAVPNALSRFADR